MREAMEEFFYITMQKKGSDLHLKANARPLIRIDGTLVPQEDCPVMTNEILCKLIYSLLTTSQQNRFAQQMELDFSYSTQLGYRFRANIMKERDNISGTFRLIPSEIPNIEQLGLPPILKDIALLKRGLVLITGPTGSGKSTTLASMIGLINATKRVNIITIEDPIEFVHEDNLAIIRQREVGSDTHSYNAALRHVLRQDPDVILIGEMRDTESISIALTAAETGHLVFSTLHTQTAPSSINRIVDVFPEGAREQIRHQLALTLQAIVSQQLLPFAGGQGRVAAVEVLTATPAIRNLIREQKEHQIYSTMETSKKEGMITMDNALYQLFLRGKISKQNALEYSVDKKAFKHKLAM